MDADKSVTAVFVEGTYSLSVSVTGSGTVAADPDEAEYDVNEEITLTATADPGYGFSHWEGDISGINFEVTFNINSNMSITAVFADTATSHLLTINSATGGSVTIDPEQNYHNDGADVELTAVPDFGYKFTEWLGDLTGDTNPATITMNGDKTITPVFLEIFVLDVAVTGSGTVTPNPDKTEYTEGESVDLTANAAAGFIFDHWEGDLTGTANPATITMDSSKNITAVFLELFSVTENITGSGSIARDPDETEYADGESVEFTATPAGGYIFDHWEGDLTGTANPVNLTMDSDKTVTAVFLELFSVTENITGSGSIVRDPDKTEYADGESVEFTATPATGYIFDHWEGDLTGSTNPATLTMDSDKTVTAVFIEREWTIIAFVDGDNNLEGAAIEDLNEMEAVDLSGTGIQVIALLDRVPGEDASNGNWTGTRLYNVLYDSAGVDGTIRSERLASTELGLTTTGNEELNMGDPATVSNFIDFCKSEYPANNYAFIFWNHGSGWRSSTTGTKSSTLPEEPLSRIVGSGLEPKTGGTVSGGYKAVCSDDTDGDILYTQEIGTSIAAKGLDVVGFDACYEGMMEVAYEIRNHASYMIGSEDTEPGDGWEYHLWLENFKASSKTAGDLLSAIVDAYETRYSTTAETTLSAIDLSEIDNVMTQLNNFTTALYNAATTNVIRNNMNGIIWEYAEDYWSAPGDLNIDIWDFADEMLTRSDYADTEAAALKTAIEAAVVNEWHHSTGNPDSHGLALHYIPLDSGGNPSSHWTAYDQSYTGLYPVSFVEASTWAPDFTNENGLLFRLWYEVY